MVEKNQESCSNRYRPITWLIGMIFLMITTCSCGSTFSPTAIYFTPTLPTPTIFTLTPAITPSVAPTHKSTATPSPTSTRTQAPPTAKPSKVPLISADIFSTLNLDSISLMLTWRKINYFLFRLMGSCYMKLSFQSDGKKVPSVFLMIIRNYFMPGIYYWDR